MMVLFCYMNISATTTRAREVIRELITIHELMREEVDFSSPNSKHAVFLILGGMITHLVRATHAIEQGDIESFGQSLRILPESRDLVTFFCEPNDKSRQVNAWFEGKIVKRNDGKKGNLSIEERTKFLETDEQLVKNMDKDVKDAIDLYSIYVHPSYDLMTVTYDHENNSFRYYAKRAREWDEEVVRDMFKLIMKQVLVSIGISLYELFLLNEIKYLKTIASLVKEYS